MSVKRSELTIADLRGGRNGADPDVSLPPTQCVAAVNVDFYRATFGRKRSGAANVALTASGLAGVVMTLIRHVPGADETAAELWAVDASNSIARYRLGNWAAVSPADAIATAQQMVFGASHNGKLFLAFDSAVDRLHVWDGTSLRRVGLGTPAAPTAANTGAGTYAATARTYKVAYITKVGSDIQRRSELSPALSFTPSGSGTAARVTKPAAINEGETHWELYAAGTAGVYYLQATTLVATTTVDDSTPPASYTGAQPPEVGANQVFPSVKYLISDGNRLLGMGAWESGGKNNRVWYSPILGASDIGDDERTPETVALKYRVDLDENDGGVGTGFGGPMFGCIYAFKYRQVWKLVPTGLSAAPYRPLCESKVIGAINQQSIVLAEDESGHPALYFLSHRGPYRLGNNGLEYLGHDLEDLWATVNLGAATVSHGIYYPAKHQVWFWIATGTGDYPTTKLVYDTKLGKSTAEGVRGGWTTADGLSAAAGCSTLFANTLGLTVSRDLKPYIGRSTGTAIWKCDTGTDDAGTAFRAYLTTKPSLLAGLGGNVLVGEPYVVAPVASGVTIAATLARDFGAETATGTVVLSATGAETRLRKKIEGLGLGHAGAVQLTIGDAGAVSNAWSLDAVGIPYTTEDRQ